MEMVKASRVVVAAFAVLLAAAPARAQGYISPFIGSPFNTGSPSGSTYGVAAGGMSTVFGGEVEFAHSPKFFADGADTRSVMTLTGNLILAIPIDAVRPYGVAGLGLIRQHRAFTLDGVFSDVTDNDFGYTLGGGMLIMMGNHFGLRTDVRRFQVRKADGFGFNRYFVGVIMGDPD
jgi:hypothetical protein